MAFGAKTLVAIAAPTIPPVRVTADNLLADVANFDCLNPIEKKALMVYVLAKQANANGKTDYSLSTAAILDALVQDTKAYLGGIPTNDLDSAKLAIMWQNSNTAGASNSTDVDTLRGLLSNLSNRTDDELDRMLLYLRLYNAA
jgi:hypothetical protein